MATTALHPAAPAYRSTLYDWVTTTDHKKIGIMYVINSFLFFFIGGLLARGASLVDAALWGVFLHAQAGRRLMASVGMIGYRARDLSAEIPALMEKPRRR